MKIKYNQKSKYLARKLRSNQTESEIKLWHKIRNKQVRGYQFLRQRPIGKYIVDFYCPKAKLIIEIDGGQHYEDKNIKQDKIRDIYFNRLGLKVIRFTNLDVLYNLDNVCRKIDSLLEQIHPSPPFIKEGDDKESL